VARNRLLKLTERGTTLNSPSEQVTESVQVPWGKGEKKAWIQEKIHLFLFNFVK